MKRTILQDKWIEYFKSIFKDKQMLPDKCKDTGSLGYKITA